MRFTASRSEPLHHGAIPLQAIRGRSGWSRSSLARARIAKISNTSSGLEERRSTPSTTISSAVCSRTEPGKSRELDDTKSRCSDALEKRKVFDPQRRWEWPPIEYRCCPRPSRLCAGSLNEVYTLQPNMLGVRIVGILRHFDIQSGIGSDRVARLDCEMFAEMFGR